MRLPSRALVDLTKHLARTSSPELETLALRRATCFAAELHRSALSQLGLVRRLPERITELEAHVADARLGLGLRLGLRALVNEFKPRMSSDEPEIAALLELTLALEVVLVHVRGWGSSLKRLATTEELESLALGVARHRRPLVCAQICSAWDRFHRLYSLGTSAPRICGDPARLDRHGIERLLAEPLARMVSPPPAPSLPRSQLEVVAAILQPMTDTDSFELSI